MSDRKLALNVIRKMTTQTGGWSLSSGGFITQPLNDETKLTQAEMRLIDGIYSQHFWGRRKFQEINNPVVHALSVIAWSLSHDKALAFQDWYNDKFVFKSKGIDERAY
jgi:hypothetical protein